MGPYATSEQLGTYLDTPVPADAARLLVRASEVVNDHTITAVYDTDDGGNPTDSVVLEALSKAVSAQVEYWLAGDEEDDVLGPVVSVGISGVQLQYGSGVNRPTPSYLAPRAARHLRSAGLLGGTVRSSQ